MSPEPSGPRNSPEENNYVVIRDKVLGMNVIDNLVVHAFRNLAMGIRHELVLLHEKRNRQKKAMSEIMASDRGRARQTGLLVTSHRIIPLASSFPIPLRLHPPHFLVADQVHAN